MYTVEQGKALMKSARKRTKNGKSWNGWCAAFVYWFTGAHRSFLTAYDSFLATKIVSKNAGKAPAGAVHYWANRGGKRRPGHVAVSLGNGIAAMASSRVTTHWGVDQGTIPIAQYNAETRGFLEYLGWSYDFGGQRMVGVKTLEAVKQIAKQTPARLKIKTGDTLSAIGRRYGISVAKLQALNKIANKNVIHVGQTIKLK